MAGLLVAVGVALAAGLIPASRELAGILGGCAILFVAGLLDDIYRLSPLAKIGAQLAAAVRRARRRHPRRDHLQRRRAPPRSASSG